MTMRKRKVKANKSDKWESKSVSNCKIKVNVLGHCQTWQEMHVWCLQVLQEQDGELRQEVCFVPWEVWKSECWRQWQCERILDNASCDGKTGLLGISTEHEECLRRKDESDRRQHPNRRMDSCLAQKVGYTSSKLVLAVNFNKSPSKFLELILSMLLDIQSFLKKEYRNDKMPRTSYWILSEMSLIVDCLITQPVAAAQVAISDLQATLAITKRASTMPSRNDHEVIINFCESSFHASCAEQPSIP